MVQLFNPDTIATQVLMDVKNIEIDVLKDVDIIQAFLNKVIEELKLNIVGECSIDFKHGITKVYLLSNNTSSSHLTLHTFTDQGKMTIDLFTCCYDNHIIGLKNLIKQFFDVSVLSIDASHFTRGS